MHRHDAKVPSTHATLDFAGRNVHSSFLTPRECASVNRRPSGVVPDCLLSAAAGVSFVVPFASIAFFLVSGCFLEEQLSEVV